MLPAFCAEAKRSYSSCPFIIRRLPLVSWVIPARREADIRTFPERLVFVVTTTTPLAPADPYIAVEAASLRIVTLSMS